MASGVSWLQHLELMEKGLFHLILLYVRTKDIYAGGCCTNAGDFSDMYVEHLLLQLKLIARFEHLGEYLGCCDHLQNNGQKAVVKWDEELPKLVQ